MNENFCEDDNYWQTTYSCAKKCEEDVLDNNGNNCWCDSFCESYNDCCPDYYSSCKQSSTVANVTQNSLPNRWFVLRSSKHSLTSSIKLQNKPTGSLESVRGTQSSVGMPRRRCGCVVPIMNLSWCPYWIGGNIQRLKWGTRVCCCHPSIFTRTNRADMKAKCCRLGASSHC